MPDRIFRSRARTAGALGTVVAVTAWFCASLIGPAQAAPVRTGVSGPCPSYIAVLEPGTWETNAAANPAVPVGMLAPVGNALVARYGPSTMQALYPAYSASAFDQGRTYVDSKRTGIDAINNILVSACATAKFVLSGFSQGADAMGDVVAAIGNGRGVIPASRVLGVGLVADPHQGTAGGTLVGPAVSGQGIGGVRPEGFGSLAPLVKQFCAPTDLYCSTNSGSDGILAGLGHIITGADTGAPTAAELGAGGSSSQPGVLSASTGAGQSGVTGPTAAPATSTASGGGPGDLAASLVTDFSRVDLPGVSGTTAALNKRLSSLPDAVTGNASQAQVASVGSSATSLLNTLTPLTDVKNVIDTHPGIRSSLAAAPAGSPQAQTSSVLETLDGMDLAGAAQSAASIASAADSILGGTGAPDAAALTASGQALTGQVAPLSSVAPDALSAAARVLSLVKPTTIVNQLVNVATGFSTLDYQGIVNNLIALPQKIAALDVAGAHQIAGTLNNEFAPIVKMAAGVDLKTLSALVAMIPDPNGAAQIASLVLGLLGNVDIIRLANDIGQIQEVGWKILESGNLLAATELLPLGLDLASVAVGVISGTASKTSPDQLGAVSDAAATGSVIGAQATSNDFAGLAGSLVGLAGSQGATDVSELARQGLDAASFFASGTHSSYADFTVDKDGRSALQWLTDFFVQKIGG